MDVEDFVPLSIEERVAPGTGSGPKAALEAFLKDLLASLADEGCTAVGHIKGMMSGDAGEPLFFSITTLENNLRFQGGPLEQRGAYALTINVIVAGVEDDRLQETFRAALVRHFETVPGPV